MKESNTVEFKLKLSDNFEKEVVAFLNYSKGGIIYIGIDDTGNCIGVKNPDKVQQQATNRIINNILPHTIGLFDVVHEYMEGVDIVKIIISSGIEKPYYIREFGRSTKGCYIRKGSNCIPMTNEMIDKLYQERVLYSLGKIESPRNDLTFEQLKIYYAERGSVLNSKYKQSLELVDNNNRLNYLAYLFADENNISIKVAKYAGKDKIDLVENQELGYCSIIKATKQVLDKFQLENIVKTKITSKERIEKRLVNEVALREAVVNAIVHNDWSTNVSPLFEIFSDRFVITSSGRLPKGLTKKEFFNCTSRPRSREIMRIFKDVGLVEELGSGMNRILSVYEKSIFEFSENYIKITFIFDKNKSTEIADKPIEIADKPIEIADKPIEIADKLQKSADKINIILKYLQENESATTKELSELIDVELRMTRYILNEMVINNLILKEGANKNRVYKLKSKKFKNTT